MKLEIVAGGSQESGFMQPPMEKFSLPSRQRHKELGATRIGKTGQLAENNSSPRCESNACFCDGKAPLYLDVTGERVSHFYELHMMKNPESERTSL